MPIWFIATISTAFAWLLYETRLLTVQIPYGKGIEIKQLPPGQPVLLLTAGNPYDYPIVFPIKSVSEFRTHLKALAGQEIELQE